jgi:hypothetical protein
MSRGKISSKVFHTQKPSRAYLSALTVKAANRVNGVANESHKNICKSVSDAKENRSTPRIPTWSPNVVLTRPEHA